MGDRMALVLLLTLSAGLVLGGMPEGGPSTFGYDASSACSKPYSRVGRARPEHLPCDFRRENWCAIAGNAYPWHAVRRFVQENQGLMRRMYGDEKHISVLKTELEKNDVELELEDDHNQLYSDDSSSLFQQMQFEVDYAFDPIANPEEEARRSREYLGRSLQSGTSSKLDKPKADGPSSPQRLNENPAITASSSTQSTTYASTATASTTSSNPSTTPGTSPSHRTKMTPVSTASTLLPSTRDDGSATTPTNFASTTPVVSLAQIAKIQNLSINEISGQIDRFDADVDELTEIPGILIEEGFAADTTADSLDGIPTSSHQYLSTSSERTDDGKISLEDYGSKFDQVQDAEVSESQQQPQQFRPRPEYRPPEAVRPEAQGPTGGSMEGQLFQDVAAKDKQEPVLKVRGINACPVKEEVVAPFWANNTRGEVLALLNLYPFEQYVHWEKCTNENKQMYCRDGCRCEQQYRLHRLLAYDPNNECRGIFSDWFKFPSCCICRCYDLPVEFRVTSRSPRLVHQRQRLKVRAPRAPPRQRHH
ncbi:protein spaetzle 4 [Nasonia vitripennis]|uniref:Spaetzle domain-containing protein n=1 Tax=Nasonia vitripennis TaxID=7425 RepID=A0A7M7PZ21_NASVI|nr:protein spaetzle 4 [Nasonia vitripennis]